MVMAQLRDARAAIDLEKVGRRRARNNGEPIARLRVDAVSENAVQSLAGFRFEDDLRFVSGRLDNVDLERYAAVANQEMLGPDAIRDRAAFARVARSQWQRKAPVTDEGTAG